MTDENKLVQKMGRGARAKALLQNDLLQEAFEKLESAIDEGWKNSEADDERVRYNAYIMHRLLKNFKNHFTQIVTKGKHAEKKLLQIRDKSKLRKIVHV